MDEEEEESDDDVILVPWEDILLAAIKDQGCRKGLNCIRKLSFLLPKKQSLSRR